MFQPEGVYVAMMTPFDEGGKVNEPVLRKMVEFQIEKGVSGLFPISTVGEFIHLSPEESMRVMEIVVDQARNRVPVTPGVSGSCASNSVVLAKHAQKIGCSAVVACTPYYYPVSQGVIEKHYETLANEAGTPIILYNIPRFTSAIEPGTVGRLSRHENIVGLKDSSGSMVNLIHCIDSSRLYGSEINVLTGRDDILLPALVVGCKGCMSVTAGVIPEVIVGIYKSWRTENYDEAKKLQFGFLELIRVCSSLPFPMGYKAAMEVRGFPMGPPKQPLPEQDWQNYLKAKNKIRGIFSEVLELV